MTASTEQFSNRVLHYATSLRGTRQYWLQQRSRLIGMVNTLAMPTIIFTHSAADFQWPDLAHVLQNDSEEFNQREAVVYNPAIADWYFYYCATVYRSLSSVIMLTFLEFQNIGLDLSGNTGAVHIFMV